MSTELLHSSFLLALYLFVALFFSFLCSIAEAAMLKVNRGFIDSIRESRSLAASILDRFQKSPEEPLAAILTVNTIAHTVGAAGVGHQAAMLFGENWLGVSSALLTFLILIGSEIIPKTLGATHWRKFAPPSAIAVSWMQFALRPLIRLLMVITEKVTHKSKVERSRSEIESTVRNASASDAVNSFERRVLSNVFSLSTTKVKEIMTPRVVVFAVLEDLRVGEFRERYLDASFSRIPVFEGDIDGVNGYVLRSDLLKSKNPELPLRELKRPMPVIPEIFSVGTLFETLTGNDCPIGVVVNEYGTTSGIVTLEDALESLVGIEIVDESDPAIDMQQFARDVAPDLGESESLPPQEGSDSESESESGEGIPPDQSLLRRRSSIRA